MPEGMFGVETNQFLIAVGGVAAGFLCLILVLWLIRGRGGPSPFLRGGKNRQPRLQVLDAAAVDTRRRLVLVRRDDVEHLIMIGGPTDVVIESSIVDGRSPPYHTMMKTVTEPDQAAIATADAPRVNEPEGRAAKISAPAPRVAEPVAPAAAPEKAAQTDDRDNFTWLGSEPVDASPAPRAAEPAKPAAPVTQAARQPETQKPAETPVAPAQSAPVAVPAEPKAIELTPRMEPRSPEPPCAANPAPVVDFPVIEPRAGVAAAAGTAPIITAFAPAAAALAAEAIVAAPAPVRSETPAALTVHEAPKASEPHFEIDPPRPANDAPSIDNAVDLLEAARERVFQQPRNEPAPSIAIEPGAASVAPVQRPAVAVVPPPAPFRAAAPATAPAKPLGSDFERILEEEMATNLAGANAAPAVGPAVQNAPASQLPRRDPNLARVTGASQEPTMQNEIARIFGEMSVTKDDR